ncbi:MAG: hypothetical protein HJJLKODD_01858 [Phycisphaerae bacterium]|nr:hypothetical protein [Phycisphaerae bacterium]
MHFAIIPLQLDPTSRAGQIRQVLERITQAAVEYPTLDGLLLPAWADGLVQPDELMAACCDGWIGILSAVARDLELHIATGWQTLHNGCWVDHTAWFDDEGDLLTPLTPLLPEAADLNSPAICHGLISNTPWGPMGLLRAPHAEFAARLCALTEAGAVAVLVAGGWQETNWTPELAQLAAKVRRPILVANGSRSDQIIPSGAWSHTGDLLVYDDQLSQPILQVELELLASC